MFKKYQKEFDYSYTLGYSTTLDLVRFQPQHVLKIIAKSGNSQNSTLQQIQEICHKHDIEYTENDRQIDKLSLKENCYIVGIFEKFPTKLDNVANHVVLVNPSDMGNLGTITRAMLGFNHLNLAIIRPACDYWAPKVVRGSMGAIFHINIEYFDSFQEYQKRFPSHHIYPFILQGQQNLQATRFAAPYSLVFGNEGEGLPVEFQKLTNTVVIKHSQDIDSLNLGVSVALALYQTTIH